MSPYTLHFFLVLLVVWDSDSRAAFCSDLDRVFLQGAQCPTQKKIFLELSDGDGPCFASTYLSYFFRVPPCPPYTIAFFVFFTRGVSQGCSASNFLGHFFRVTSCHTYTLEKILFYFWFRY